MAVYSLRFRIIPLKFKNLRGLNRVNAERMLPLMGESRIQRCGLAIQGHLFKAETRKNLLTMEFPANGSMGLFKVNQALWGKGMKMN